MARHRMSCGRLSTNSPACCSSMPPTEADEQSPSPLTPIDEGLKLAVALKALLRTLSPKKPRSSSGRGSRQSSSLTQELDQKYTDLMLHASRHQIDMADFLSQDDLGFFLKRQHALGKKNGGILKKLKKNFHLELDILRQNFGYVDSSYLFLSTLHQILKDCSGFSVSFEQLLPYFNLSYCLKAPVGKLDKVWTPAVFKPFKEVRSREQLEKVFGTLEERFEDTFGIEWTRGLDLRTSDLTGALASKQANVGVKHHQDTEMEDDEDDFEHFEEDDEELDSESDASENANDEDGSDEDINEDGSQLSGDHSTDEDDGQEVSYPDVQDIHASSAYDGDLQYTDEHEENQTKRAIVAKPRVSGPITSNYCPTDEDLCLEQLFSEAGSSAPKPAYLDRFEIHRTPNGSNAMFKQSSSALQGASRFGGYSKSATPQKRKSGHFDDNHISKRPKADTTPRSLPTADADIEISRAFLIEDTLILLAPPHEFRVDIGKLALEIYIVLPAAENTFTECYLLRRSAIDESLMLCGATISADHVGTYERFNSALVSQIKRYLGWTDQLPDNAKLDIAPVMTELGKDLQEVALQIVSKFVEPHDATVIIDSCDWTEPFTVSNSPPSEDVWTDLSLVSSQQKLLVCQKRQLDFVVMVYDNLCLRFAKSTRSIESHFEKVEKNISALASIGSEFQLTHGDGYVAEMNSALRAALREGEKTFTFASAQLEKMYAPMVQAMEGQLSRMTSMLEKVEQMRESLSDRDEALQKSLAQLSNQGKDLTNKAQQQFGTRLKENEALETAAEEALRLEAEVQRVKAREIEELKRQLTAKEHETQDIHARLHQKAIEEKARYAADRGKLEQEQQKLGQYEMLFGPSA